MRYLKLSELLDLYYLVMQQTGGLSGVREIGTVISALYQPQMMFGGVELYSTVIEKAAVLGFSIIQNHPLAESSCHRSPSQVRRSRVSDK